MAKAEVKLTLSPTDFQLIISSLKNELDLAREEEKDHRLPPGSEEWKEMHQQIIQLEALIRLLA